MTERLNDEIPDCEIIKRQQLQIKSQQQKIKELKKEVGFLKLQIFHKKSAIAVANKMVEKAVKKYKNK
jgi:hypothetical protein